MLRLAVLIALAVVFHATARGQSPAPVVISVHRSGHFICPENTYEAQMEMWRVGVDGVDNDLRYTLDGVLVLHHDAQTSLKSGGYLGIEEMVYDEVVDVLRPGAVWYRGYEDVRVPRFENVLRFAATNDLKLYLDDKSGQPGRPGKAHALRLMETFAASGLNGWMSEGPEILSHRDKRDADRIFIAKRLIERPDAMSWAHIDDPRVLLAMLGRTSRTGPAQPLPVSADEAVKEDFAKLEATLLEADGDESVRRRVAARLAKADPRRAAALFRQQLENPAVARHAAWGLGHIGQSGDVSHLTKVLADPHNPAREMAAYALGRIGDSGAVESLCSVLEEEEFGAAQHAAAWALKKIGDDRAWPVVKDALERALPDAGAFHGLFAGQDREQAAAKLHGLTQLVLASGRLGSDEAVPVIVEAFKKNRALAQPALAALADIDTPKAEAGAAYIYQSDERNRRLAVFALAKMGAHTALVKLLRHAQSEEVQDLVLQLMSLPEAADVLVAQLEEDPGPVSFQSAAALVLGFIGEERHAAAMLPLLESDDPMLRENAAWSIDRIGGADARAAVREKGAGPFVTAQSVEAAREDYARIVEATVVEWVQEGLMVKLINPLDVTLGQRLALVNEKGELVGEMAEIYTLDPGASREVLLRDAPKGASVRVTTVIDALPFSLVAPNGLVRTIAAGEMKSIDAL